MPVTVLLTVAGLQEPANAFVDVAGNIGAGDPLQIAVNGVNVDATGLFNVSTKVAVGKPHCPVAGVKL